MNKKNSIYYKSMTILFILFLLIMVLLNGVRSEKLFSETENRRLEQRPDFSIKALMNGKFTSDFEKYISDQFVFRDFWIEINSKIILYSGKNQNNDVFLGKTGYLIQKFNTPDKGEFTERLEAINAFADKIPEVNKYFMVVPNSVKVLQEKLPYLAPGDDELYYIDEVKKKIDSDINFIDVYEKLSSKKNEYIYYKTDHHWTTKGAYYAYQKLMESVGTTYHDNNYFDIKNVTDSFYGSLYSKSGFRNIKPDSIELYIPKVDEGIKVDYLDNEKSEKSLYTMDNLNKKDKYTVFLNGNHPLIKISTNNKNGKKLLLIKDSYANSFVPFLTGHYSEIYLVDLRYYNDDITKIIKSNDIDDILFLYNAITFFEDLSIKNLIQ
ncbi:DHHW family protein [Clostridium sediminicola]|uniref:DHHW family protein n=1 Tax=Clostridium sediminicola TaxID=3114879 RepID=UPI0031F25145